MTISVILTKIERDFLQFSRENLKNRKIFLPFCFFPTDKNMIDWIRKKKPFGLFAQGNGSSVRALPHGRSGRTKETVEHRNKENGVFCDEGVPAYQRRKGPRDL